MMLGVDQVKDEGDGEVVGEVQQASSGSPLLLGTVIILHALNHLINGSLPVLYPSIMQEFHLSYVQLGFLRSASSLAGGFPQMFVSLLRRWLTGRVLIALGNLLTSVMTMFASLVGGFNEFLVLRVIGGICGSPQHPIGTSMLTTNTDPAWRGRIFGLNMAVPTLASTISPLVATWLLVSMGWRMSLFTLAIPALLGSIILLVFVKDSGARATAKRCLDPSPFQGSRRPSGTGTSSPSPC
jgi:MFS family permease